MTHGAIPREVREAHGLTDTLLRLSVGIEDSDDLLADRPSTSIAQTLFPINDSVGKCCWDNHLSNSIIGSLSRRANRVPFGYQLPCIMQYMLLGGLLLVMVLG